MVDHAYFFWGKSFPSHILNVYRRESERAHNWRRSLHSGLTFWLDLSGLDLLSSSHSGGKGLVRKTWLTAKAY